MENINSLNKTLENLNALEILRFISENYKGSAVFSSSLGAEDQVITDMIFKENLGISIFTLDTGRLPAETYKLIHNTNEHYNTKIKVMFPDYKSVEKMVNEHGINLFYESVENRKLCCNIRKIEPLKRALKGNQIWITGLRKTQSVTRGNLNIAGYDQSNKITKVNPLLNWTEEEIWNYIKKNNVPYNSLHDKNYPSIGCAPCTRSIQPGEDIRAGRWWWEHPESKECGLHIVKN